MAQTIDTEVLVLGAGPGGYAAAFLAADLGMQATMVDAGPKPGGTCLLVGCIPSKALLHAAHVIHSAQDAAAFGLKFAKPEIDLAALRAKKDKIIDLHSSHLADLCKKRGVHYVNGRGVFTSRDTVQVEKGSAIRFKHAVIATGSAPTKLPAFEIGSGKIWDSTAALKLELVPKSLLVVGGGYIGLEMGSVYAALGSKVTVVELMPSLLPGVDSDLVRHLHARLKNDFANIFLKTKVTKVEDVKDGVKVTFEGEAPEKEATFERVLVAVGRRPSSVNLGLDKASVNVTEKGFVVVDDQRRTSNPNVFAIGDVAGEPMLAHKATHEGKVAAEAAAGRRSHFDARAIPSVAYTDPEVAWAGLTETQAKAQGIAIEKGAFPWMASGRSLSLGREEGMTKLIFDPATRRVLGGGIVGPNAGELIAEIVLAIEMGADAADIGLTVHPHPTLSETVCFAAEAFEGTLTDLYLPKKPAPRTPG